MKKLKPLLVLGLLFFLVPACKKSSNTSTTTTTATKPSTTTQWTFNNVTYNGTPAQWYYDTTGSLGYLSSGDSTGTNYLEIAFLVPGPTAKPNPGKYYFVNSNATNVPSGIQPSQICIMAAGPPANTAFSIGGTLTDTATVYYNTSNKLVVYFSNIGVTGGIKVSGTLVE